ncbi:MAG: hypothetical protein FJ275_08210, partial [Planctomycetes bacterium]|nr:hypothetical protein [Planctomycetota bacterium]
MARWQRFNRFDRFDRWSIATLAATPVATDAMAGEADWPSVTAPLPADWRGRGGGIAVASAVIWWLVVLAWVRTVDWVHRDATKHGIAPAFWSSVCGLPLPLTALVAWWIRSLAAGIALMVLAWLVPVGVYAFFRNRRVTDSERILTPGHGRRIVARLLAPLGIEISESVREEEVLPKVELAALGGKDEAENKARLTAAQAAVGFEEFRRQMLAAVVARAATAVIEVASDTTVRHEVDGVWGKPRVRQPPRSRKEKEAWVEVPPSSRDVGEAVVAAGRAVCGLAAGAGTGRFAVRVDGRPRNARLTLRTERGVRQAVIQIESSDAVFKRLVDLGIPEPVAARLGELVAAERGLVLLSSPLGGGLTTTFDLVVESADRLLRDFISIEDAARPPREIQNVKPVRYDARTGVTPVAALADALREYPSAIVSRDVRDKDLVVELVRLAAEGKFVVMSVKASDAVEAVTRVLSCGVPPQQLGATLLGSLSQRLVRRLCVKCREETPPPLQLLARLKLTAEQLPHIRKASDAGCRLCQGSGYLGRTGLFELASGATLRRAVAGGGS